MITLAIVAILSAIAYPGYRNYVLKAHRTDAERVLTNNAQILQRCYTQNFTYTGCANLAVVSPNGYYTVANTVAAATYSLVATAVGNQTADTSCASFTVTQTGTQTALSSANAVTTTTCWGGT